jgi:hypothetical protein
LFVITPTGGRPEALALLDKYLQRQTNQDFTWVILDDCEPTSPIPERCDIHIDAGWVWDGENTQSISLLRLLNEVGTDKTIVCEDDDWYSPEHVQIMSDLLDKADVVGQKPTVYYNIHNRTYKPFYKTNHSCLCQTAFKGAAVEHLRTICQENATNIDVTFWKTWQGSKHLDESMTAVGIKGMKGRGGIGVGHKMQGTKDPKGHKLSSLIGDDIKNYL